jgi:serine/threonine-protein kinase HipA
MAHCLYGAAPQVDTAELWRRIAFSILITNVDDHLRNHSFLHIDRGQWRLAPAFDVNPFPNRIRELKTWISEGAGPEATIEAIMSALSYFRIAKPCAREILWEVEQAVSRWRPVGRSLGMTTQELNQFAEAFEHEERAACTVLFRKPRIVVAWLRQSSHREGRILGCQTDQKAHVRKIKAPKQISEKGRSPYASYNSCEEL